MNLSRCAVVGSLLVTASLHSAAQQPTGSPIPNTGGLTARAVAPRVLPATRSDVFGTIQGNALNSTNGQLPNAVMRLRDARFGRIVDSQVTDQSGLFAFKALDPGSYIVEMLAGDQTVLAASQVLPVNAGEAVSAVVKLPFRVPPFAGVLGNGVPSAVAVTTEAAASGVLAVTTTGEPTCP